MTLINKVPGEIPEPRQIRPLVAPAYSYRFLELVILKRLRKNIELRKNDPAFKRQFGFIKNRRVSQAVQALFEDLEVEKEDPYLVAVFWDIKSAYESVDR